MMDLRQETRRGGRLLTLAMGAALAGCGGVAAAQSGPVLHTPAVTAAPATAEAGDSAAAGAAKVPAMKASAPVPISVLVTDRKGKPVTSLTAADLSVQVDGKPQAVSGWMRQAELPLMLGLVLDESSDQRGSFEDERSAGMEFLSSALQTTGGARTAAAPAGAAAPAAGTTAAGGVTAGGAGDRAFVVQYGTDIEMLQEPTAENARLKRALGELGTPAPNAVATPVNATGTDSEGRRIRVNSKLYDAIFLSTDEILGKQTGAKVLVVFSDGIDRGSKESLADALEAAQRANTVIYAVYLKGEEPRQSEPRRNAGGNGRSGGSYPGSYPGGGGWPGGGGGYPRGGGYPGQSPNGNGGNTPPTGGGEHKPNVDGRQVLERIAGETGGRVYTVDRHGTVTDALASITADLGAQYQLSFTPTGDAAREKYHEMTVTLAPAQAKDKLDVATRDGYWGGSSR